MFSWVGSVTTQILYKALTTADEEELDDLDHDLYDLQDLQIMLAG